MKFDCVERALHRFFFRYGGFVAERPLPFLLFPVVAAVLLTSGVVFMTIEGDIENLYTPDNSQSKHDRKIVEDLYAKFGDEDKLPIHATRVFPFGQAILRPKISNNALTVPVMEEALRLHAMIENISIQYAEETLRFSDLCFLWQGECYKVNILKVINYNAIEVESRPLTFPFAASTTGETLFIGSELGNVTFRNGSTDVSKAGLMLLTYFLRYGTELEKEIWRIWEEEFVRQVSQFNSEVVDIFPSASRLLELELKETVDDVIPFVAICFAVLVSFAIWTTTMADNVRSKPLLGIFGVISSCLAVGSTFGLMAYIGVPYTYVVGPSPFLVLGIGIDDMFLMVASWRRTDIHQSTKDRMSKAFAHAALSITITSVTDALAFGIGSITSFYSVRIFCVYTGVAVLFDYLYQITFFAACMALTGYQEEKNLHALTCRKVFPKDQATSALYRVCCAGGSSTIKLSTESNGRLCQRHNLKKVTTEHAIMLFFRTHYGPFITQSYIAYASVVFYIVYIGIAIWGIVTLEEGLQLDKLSPDGSHSEAFYEIHLEYFRSFGIHVSIVATEELEYSNPDIQEKINQSMSELENSDLFYGSKFSISWLREYQKYLKQRDPFGTQPSGHLSESMFVYILQEEFLRIPNNKRFIPDIVFDNVTNTIVSSRFYVLSRNTNSPSRERSMMVKSRRIAKNSGLPLIAYQRLFILYDQYIEIRPHTIQNLGIALATMFLVSLVMIPDPICSVLVTISLVSIVMGVIGFMSHWDIALDAISMLNLIICVGFSVDFSAHISYAFMHASGESSRLRAIHALYSVGMPIVQAAISTILACFVLEFTNSYIFRVFFRTMLLVNVFGTIHGLVFLPVFLMLFVPLPRRSLNPG